MTRALTRMAKAQMINQSRRYFLTNRGLSFICPVVMSVVREINKNAKGRATVGLVSSASAIRIIAAKPPKIRKLSIIREVRTCRIRSTSIRGFSCVIDGSCPAVHSCLFILFKKVVSWKCQPQNPPHYLLVGIPVIVLQEVHVIP
jgi:hypothetical protein